VAQLFPRDDLPGAFHQFGKDLKRLFLQLDLDPVATEFTGAQIEFEDAKAPCGCVAAVCVPHNR
jgi:hypothetical protein